MDRYFSVIRQAFYFFPVIAFLFTIPYLIYNYRKYGSIWSLRILIVYSFVLYLMTVLFLTSLPLPDWQSVKNMSGPRAQLVPFAFVSDIIRRSHFSLTEPSTWLTAMKTTAFKEYIANILMLVPFGMYMRYYFKRSFWQTVGLSFLFSLFIETTQLTGLWFLYPRNYRLFDVDDLMSNTLGGLLGYVLLSPVIRFLPSRSKIDQASYLRGQTVSIFRRLVALGIDLFVCAGSAWILQLYYPVFKHSFWSWMLILAVFGSTQVAWIFHGRTLGMILTGLKIVDVKNGQPQKKRAALWRLFVRFGLEYGFLIVIPLLMFWIPRQSILHSFLIDLFLAIVYLSVMMASLLFSCQQRQSLFGKLTATKVVSDIRLPAADSSANVSPLTKN